MQSSKVLLLHPFGGFNDFNLPINNAVINALFSDVDFAHLPPEKNNQASPLLDQFANIFAEGPHDFGLAKSLFHQIDTGDAPLFQDKPYRKSRVEKVAVSKELKQLLDAGLHAPSQSPWASLLLILKDKNGGH